MTESKSFIDQRRRFLEQILAASVLSLAAPTTLLGSLRILLEERGGRYYGRYRIDLAAPEYASLRTLGGSVRIEDVAGQGISIIVSRTAADRFAAVGGSCTHRPCDLPAANSSGTITCPCHGAQFRADGTVTKGPATMNLPTYQTYFDGSILEIELPGISSAPALAQGIAVIGAVSVDALAGRVTVSVALERDAEIRLVLVDATGRRHATSPSKLYRTGVHRLATDIAGLASGAYFVQVLSGNRALVSAKFEVPGQR